MTLVEQAKKNKRNNYLEFGYDYIPKMGIPLNAKLRLSPTYFLKTLMTYLYAGLI